MCLIHLFHNIRNSMYDCGRMRHVFYYRKSSSMSPPLFVSNMACEFDLNLFGSVFWQVCECVREFGDDIPMVCARKQDHFSWMGWSVQTHTHATLRPPLCSALPWWHNPKFYCQCEYLFACVGCRKHDCQISKMLWLFISQCQLFWKINTCFGKRRNAL